MLGFAIVAMAIVGTGHLITRRGALVMSALAGLAAWLAANWALSLAGALTRRNLWIVVALFVVAACASLLRGRSAPSPLYPAPWPLLIALAVAAWCAFVLWRGSVVPPASDDVLSYHLPKALMIARVGGVEHFAVPDPRIRTFPANYELLLADVLLLTGSDRLTEWIGTASYLLFLGVVALFAREWWGRGLHVAASVLAAAGAPLLLIHSGHDKNDLLTAAYAAAAIFWSARWCVRRGAESALLAILCGVVAIGTKMSAAAVALGALPFGIASIIRRPPRARAFLCAVATTLLILILCGGWVFVLNARASAEHRAVGGLPTSQYGEWQHLWELPYRILFVSLGLRTSWPWPSDNLYSSHYGFVFGVAVLALPFCIWRYRGEREAAVAGGIAVIAFAVLLPLVQYPRVALPSILRYTAFILPVVLAWTVAPVVRELVAKRSAYAHALLAVLLVVFVFNGADAALNDAFAPLQYARWCADNPRTRQIYWQSGRAESAVDRLAGPWDTIALATGQDAWIYPAYGASLSRKVVFVEAPAEVPSAARWVVLDQLPGKTSGPNAEELQFFQAMQRDPRFALVYRQQTMNQAVFRRIR